MKYLELSEQNLMEINMSPSTLRKLAADIDARAGMEFEMIVPNVANPDDDYYESEPDYDADESVRDFDDIRNFFHDGDHNSRRDVDRLIEQLEEEFLDSDWLDEKKREYWENESTQAIRDLVERDYEDELMSQAEEEVQADTPEFGVNAEELDTAIQERYQELFDEKVDSILADMGSEYDEAFDEWVNDEWYRIIDNEDLRRDWLEHQGYHAMSDISNNYDINWPHWTTPDQGGEGSIEEVADDFSNSIDRPINWSSNYHGAKRAEGHYVVEPDGSLEADDDSDTGLEFVSPPLPVSELLDDLKKVKKWAGLRGCYTNDSTGLHINVSVPGFSAEKLDYVKLALLLGDEYVLEQFGRTGNTYAKSALSIVKQHIKQRPEDAQALLAKMKEHLNTAAAKVIHSGSTNKYTSINNKTGYIEFRSPGGDWLDENFDKIENTLLRFVVALDAAIDETKYKQDYAKKLYKLLAPGSNEPGILELFANFSAGELDKEALIRQVRAAQLERDIAKGKAPAGQKYWWNVQWDSNRRIEVVAPNKAVARQVAAEEWGVPESQLAIAKVTMLRPYEEPKPRSAADNQGNWGIWIGGSERFAREPNTPVADNVLRRFPSQAAAMAFLERSREENPRMRTDVQVREIPSDYQLPDTPVGRPVASAGRFSNRLSQTDIENRLGWGGQEADANYEVVDRSNNQSVFKFIANTPQEAQRKYGQVLDVFGFPHDTENYGFRAIGRAGVQQWEIVNHNTGEVVERVNGSRQDANLHAMNTYGHRFIFDVRPAGAQQ